MPRQSVSVCPVEWTRTSFHLVSIRGHLYRRVLTEDDSFFEVSHIACKIDYLNEKKKSPEFLIQNIHSQEKSQNPWSNFKL